MFTPKECPWCGDKEINLLFDEVWNCNSCNSYIEESDFNNEVGPE